MFSINLVNRLVTNRADANDISDLAEILRTHGLSRYVVLTNNMLPLSFSIVVILNSFPIICVDAELLRADKVLAIAEILSASDET